MIRLIGVGNFWRRDDGVGIWIARQLAGLNLPGVEVLERSGEGTALLEAWRGARRVFLFDALQGSGESGTVHRIDTRRALPPRELFTASSHVFGLAEALKLAQALGEMPQQLVIYGVEGMDFGSGEGLTPAVVAGAQKVVERLLIEISPRLA